MRKSKPKKSGAPFGVATKRFNRMGLHPELDVSGAMKKEITKLGPNSFYPKPKFCTFKQGINWKRKNDLEEYSKFLGYRNARILRERQFRKTLGGPGFNDINYEASQRKTFSVLDNMGMGAGERFKRNIMDDIPPPGTYRNICGKTFKEPLTKTPHFEWDGFVPRFEDTNPIYWQPPNLYDCIYPSGLAVTLRKVVGLRGPYDLFTGPRDGSTIKNYFAPPISCAPDKYFVPPDFIAVLTKRKGYGKFLMSDRMPRKPTIKSMMEDISLCYKDPDRPGPTTYNLENTNSIRVASPTIHPFNNSSVHVRPATDWRIHPGPGRYNPRTAKCLKLKRASWVFLSKNDRQFFTPPEDYNAF